MDINDLIAQIYQNMQILEIFKLLQKSKCAVNEFSHFLLAFEFLLWLFPFPDTSNDAKRNVVHIFGMWQKIEFFKKG